jgi:hypothetical protein
MKKVFLVRFTELREQISICEKSLEEHKEKMESLVYGLTFSSQFLSQSQLEKIKKQVASISRTYDETAEKLNSLLREREGLHILVSFYEDIVDIKLLIIEIKHPLLLEEYSALQYKISQLGTGGLKTSEEDSVLELLIKKKTNNYDLIFKIFTDINISVLEEKHSSLLKEYCELIAKIRRLTTEELKSCETENLEVLVKNKKKLSDQIIKYYDENK